jgi:thiamine-phosphate pyrophosphorylase
MASALAREHLARAARAINAGAHADWLPALVLMTDEKRLGDPLSAARALPKGAAVILRHTDAKARARLATQLKIIARARGLWLLIAGDAPLAARIAADGLHLPQARAREAAHWKALHASWLITAAAHSARGLAVAAGAGADAALLAPVFSTASHRERAALGVARLRLMVTQAALPVYALGGITAANAGRLGDTRLAGIAAIGALTPDQSS